jgi:hypothetical protein
MTNNRTVTHQELAAETAAQLHSVDERLGSRLEAVFAASVQTNPELAYLLIEVFEDDEFAERNLDPNPMMGITGTGLCVVLPRDTRHYEKFVSGFAAQRLGRAQDHVRRVQGSYGLVDAMNLTAAHELGHADAIQALVARVGVDAAVDQLNANYRKEMWSLPLCMESTSADDAWQHNRGGYRTTLERAGIDEAQFDGLLMQNSQAYGELPSEAAADNFAYAIAVIVY